MVRHHERSATFYRGIMILLHGIAASAGFASNVVNATYFPFASPTSGFGTHTDGRTGAKYVGKWVGGKRNGNGTETSASGARWTGTWEDDLKHGKGTQTTADGVVTKGVWNKGELVEELGEGSTEEKKD